MEDRQKEEMTKIEMAFLGFLMGVGSILGIWIMSGLLQAWLG